MMAALCKDRSGISSEHCKEQSETELIPKQKHCLGSLEEEGIAVFHEHQSRNTHLSTGDVLWVSQFKCWSHKWGFWQQTGAGCVLTPAGTQAQHRHSLTPLHWEGESTGRVKVRKLMGWGRDNLINKENLNCSACSSLRNCKDSAVLYL